MSVKFGDEVEGRRSSRRRLKIYKIVKYFKNFFVFL